MARHPGWLIAVLAALSSTTIEAQLCSCGFPCEVSVTTPLTGIEEVDACLSITAGGGCYVEFPAWVTMKAGESITLGDNFWVEADTELTLEIDSSLACDPAIDSDNDLFDACLDCDDGDDAVYPGAGEECNGVDDDCDLAIDNDVACDDSLDCTEDVCLGVAGCDAGLLPGFCLIEGSCRAAGETLPGDVCWVCDPTQSTTDWTPNDGAACDDGVSCTTDDMCDSGSCTGTPYTCDDSLACTEDLCSGDGACSFPQLPGSCLIEGTCYDAGDPLPGNPCWVCDPAQSTMGWTPNDGAACNDGDSCTADDSCDAGSCSGTPYSCDDSLACTEDLCSGDGACSFPQAPGSCLIEGTCYDAGDALPGNSCWVCDPAQSTMGWTPNDGAACDDGDSCTTGDVCGGGSCSGSAILDAYESNQTRGTAANLGSIDDQATWPAGTFSASLYPAGDVDWYDYHVDDTPVGQMGPRVALNNIPVGANYQLCAYYECDKAPTTVDCETGSASQHDGLPGCCSTQSGAASELVRLAPDCGGALNQDDGGTTYVHVYRDSGAWICAQYSLSWGDD